MIHGNSPSGYVATADKKVIGETRQCAHCQFTWIYQPGSGSKRGICLKCMGLLCGKEVCARACAPYSEITLQDDKRYVLEVSGVYLKR